MSVIRRSLSITIRLPLIVLLASAWALAQEPAQAVRGTWIATVGKGEVYHGTWTGGALPHHPNVAQGTWTLSSAGQVVLQGTWQAEKSSHTWDGRWAGRTATGQSLAGYWGADVQHWHGKTFQDMLERTLVEQISGWWQAGQAGGNWWLKGSHRAAR